MKNNLVRFGISLSLLALGCNTKKDVQKSKITRVVFATGGCFRSCPILAIDMNATLTVKYHGVMYTTKTGFYRGLLDKHIWDSLTFKLDALNFEHLDSSYSKTIDDLATEILIYHEGKVKHIYGQSASLPVDVMNVYSWLLNSIPTFELKPTSDSLVFPTTIEKPLSVPPPPLDKILNPSTNKK